MPMRVAISYLILYLPPLLTGKVLMQRNLILSRQSCFNASATQIVEKRPASRSQINFKIVDAGIMNGFETLTRLGGYIMLFSMIASMLQKLPLQVELVLLLTGITEITNGISEITDIIHSANLQYITAIGFTAFGGISGIAQTSSMIKDTELSLRPYILTKLWLTLCSTLLAWFTTYYLLT